MSGSDHAILDLGEDELQFTQTDYKAQNAGASMTEFPAMVSPDSPSSSRDTARLVDDEGREGTSSNFWSLTFYQQLFDIDTVDVRNRLMYSMLPVPGKSFLQHHIRPRPDLYGPFWVCVTLVFSIAISGNVADFLQKSVAMDDHKWHYDFHKVSLAATAVFSYASILPASLYGFLWWAGGAGASGAALSFLELVCLYGYSLSIYVPVSILWLIQVSWWQWLCVLLGAGLSGAVLFTPLWPAVRDGASKGAWVVMGIVLCLHLLLACGFMLYFFHVPPTSGGAAGSNNVTEVVTKVQQQEGGAVQEQEVSKEEEKPVKESTSEKRSVSQGAAEGDQQTHEDGEKSKQPEQVDDSRLKSEEEGDNGQASAMTGELQKETDETENGGVDLSSKAAESG